MNYVPGCEGTHTYSGLHKYETRANGRVVCQYCGKVARWEDER